MDPLEPVKFAVLFAILFSFGVWLTGNMKESIEELRFMSEVQNIKKPLHEVMMAQGESFMFYEISIPENYFISFSGKRIWIYKDNKPYTYVELPYSTKKMTLESGNHKIKLKNKDNMIEIEIL
ncbi:MAG: hypothetical protein ACE5K4_10525 [Candidatus Hydrothermarchaeota archaeon]